MKSCNPLRTLLILASSLSVMACSAPHDDHHHDEDHHHDDQPHDTQHSHTSQAETKTNKSKTQTSTIRSADSHVHGGASLSVATEKNSIFMEFETPLFNLLGFEYEPRSSDERARVQDVETQLATPEDLFRFNKAAKCTFNQPRHKPVLFEPNSEDHDHKDVLLRYSLNCKAIEKLKNIEVLFFKNFSHLTEMELVYLGPKLQMRTELSPSKLSADLTP